MPKSLRENGSVTESYRASVRAKLAGMTVEKGKRLSVEMKLFGRWLSSTGAILRRDHLNYVAVLIDVICDCLHIDDSQVWVWDKLTKVDSPVESVLVIINYC